MSSELLRLRILHLEDELRDADLVHATLAAERIDGDITRVDTREAYLAALEEGRWDVILADYQLPSFDGVSAQLLAQERSPAVPFIFVSGTFGEEIAIERLKAGATDYVLKQRLSRLGPCVRRALREAEDRRQRRLAEAELRRLNADLERRVADRTIELRAANAELARQEQRLHAVLDNSPAIITLKDLRGRYILVNSRFEGLFHTTCQEVVGKIDDDLFPPVLARLYRANDAKVIESGSPLEAEEIVVVDGATRVYSSIKFPLRDAAGEPAAICGISIDITERKSADDQIKIARLEAEQANRAKSEFLSRMSHDLRTPLNAILGFAQLMESDVLTPDGRDSVTQIRNAGEHLLSLIDEVLDIARIETGHLALALEPVSVRDITRRAVELITPLASRREIVIREAMAASARLYVLADRQRLSQILLNLLSNAVKYNRHAGEVTITCDERVDGHARIRVRDTGPGIPPERLSRLFRPFDRLGAERSGVEGTGLGLTVARELARAMGGSLDVESQTGEGTVFWIELPLAEPPALLEAARSAPRADPRHTRADVSGCVLYVDDNRSNARLLERVLARRPGVRLSAAALGAEGLAAARRERPGLILLDLHLPDMHGGEVLRALKNDATTRDIPVAILSADATSGREHRLIEAGAIAYLTKPLEIARVLRLVDDALQRPAGAPQDVS